MIINLLKNKVFTNHQLTRVAQAEIRLKISKDHEESLNRKINAKNLGLRDFTADELIELDNYKTNLFIIEAESNKMKIDNALLIATLNYEKAKKRLERYLLSEGKPSSIIYDENGDEIGLTEVVEPLSALVDSYDDDGLLIRIENKLIAQDELQRSKAQIIVNNSTSEVIQLSSKRQNNV